jgi:hypothetical protein
MTVDEMNQDDFFTGIFFKELAERSEPFELRE